MARRRWLRWRWARRAGDRGSVSVFTAVFAIAVVFLLALILDGGIAMNARQRAADIAGQAARAAADDIDLALLRAGAVGMAPGACTAAGALVATYAADASTGVDAVTHAVMPACIAPYAAQQATVTVTITTRPLVPGIFPGFTETATVSARTECGTTQGGNCP